MNDFSPEIWDQAKAKLARIISREGDLDGERRKPYYLKELACEISRMQGFSQYCTEKMGKELHV